MDSSPRRRRSIASHVRARLVLAALLAVVLTTGVAPRGRVIAAETALPAGVTPIGGIVTFHGRGYGHGVGLSQYGARGRALAGQTADAMLAHYYRGASATTTDPKTAVRVLLLSGWRASTTAPLVVVGRWSSWSIEGVPGTWPANARLTLTPSSSTATGRLVVAWRLKVLAADGAVLLDRAHSAAFRVRPSSRGVLDVAAKPATRNRFRGALRVLPRTDATTVSVVNEVALDLYLRGVVPVEMPSTWPVEALRAQAVVARSYAARHLRPGTSYYDVFDDTRSQVYHGVHGERGPTNTAILDTAGRVLQREGQIANTVFHSTAGGHTEHNENVFVSSTGTRVAGPVSYLRGVPDLAPDGTRYDAAAPYASWTSSTWTAAQLSTWLGADARTSVGAVRGLDLRSRGVSGRLLAVTIHGTTGVKRVSADVFRSIVNGRKPAADRSIRSNLFALAPLP
jgi:SpoIID/LytB domain protein